MGWILGVAGVLIVLFLAGLGVAPWIAIVPVALFAVMLIFIVPVLAARERPSQRERAGSGVPSTRDASYEPVTDPSER
jgi:hypothetical protein